LRSYDLAPQSPTPSRQQVVPLSVYIYFEQVGEMCQLTKNIQKIVTKLSEILVVPQDPEKTVPDFGPGVKKAADTGSRSATLLEIVPDIDGILRNVVRHLLVFIHVAGGNRQHRPVVREGQARTAKTDNEHNLRRPVVRYRSLKKLLSQHINESSLQIFLNTHADTSSILRLTI
jgi:hypothetical protein